jgi:hypothetical protein
VDLKKHSNKRPEVEFHKNGAETSQPKSLIVVQTPQGESAIYRHIPSMDKRGLFLSKARTLCKVTHQTQNLEDGGLEYQYQPDTRIVWSGDTLRLCDGETESTFSQGEMVDIEKLHC